MIYYALRSNAQYLALLDANRGRPEAHHLLSIAGGLAFLHAIGPGTQQIRLIDSDPEVLAYAEMMVAVLRRTESLAEFITLLSGHALNAPVSASLEFGAPVDCQPILARLLPETRYRHTWDAAYRDRTFDPRLGEAYVADARILFSKLDLQPKTFCWRFGAGNFADETIFAQLQRQLRNCPISFQHGRMEDADFSLLHDERLLVALVSNADSPMFTARDRIFRHIRKQHAPSVHYLSWIRDCRISAGQVTAPVSADREPIFSLASAVYEVLSCCAREFFPQATEYLTCASLSELEQRRPHASEVFFCAAPLNDLLPVLPQLLDILIPAFKRLVFLLPDNDSRCLLQLALVEQNVEESYCLIAHEHEGRPVIFCRLLGMLPPK
jgi:hypothetical protein